MTKRFYWKMNVLLKVLCELTGQSLLLHGDI